MVKASGLTASPDVGCPVAVDRFVTVPAAIRTRGFAAVHIKHRPVIKIAATVDRAKLARLLVTTTFVRKNNMRDRIQRCS